VQVNKHLSGQSDHFHFECLLSLLYFFFILRALVFFHKLSALLNMFLFSRVPETPAHFGDLKLHLDEIGEIEES